jgi:hypothetical protein
MSTTTNIGFGITVAAKVEGSMVLRLLIWKIAALLAMFSSIMALSMPQKLLLIEPAIEGTPGFDIHIYPHCINNRGHAAGVISKIEQNRTIYYPFIWTPDDGMILLPEPTNISDQGNTYTVPVYGVRVLNLSDNGELLLRLYTDWFFGPYVLVGWSPSERTYRVIRSENGDIYYGATSCMPRRLFNSSFIAAIDSSSFNCRIDGYYDDEQGIYVNDPVVNIYRFNYNSMTYSTQLGSSINLSSLIGGYYRQYYITSISSDGNAVVGQDTSSAYPFCVYKDESGQWRGVLLSDPATRPYGYALVVTSDQYVVTFAGNRRRTNNQYMPFVAYISRSQNFLTVTDFDVPSIGTFTPNYADVVAISADRQIVVGNALQREQGNLIASKAYQWTPSRGVEYIEDKYKFYYPLEFSFPFIIDMSSNGRYMLLRVAGSCAGYGVLDTQGEPMVPDNPTVIMRNETASRIANAPNERHAYPFVNDNITLALVVRHRGKYYSDPAVCQILTTGKWFVPGHRFRVGTGSGASASGGEATDFSHSHLAYSMPRVEQWSGRSLSFEWYRTKHKADLETSLSSVQTGYRWVPRLRVYVPSERRWVIAEGSVYHRWYMYDYEPDRDMDRATQNHLWSCQIRLTEPGTYRYYVRCSQGSNGRWIGLHQPKPGPWQDPAQDESVFGSWELFLAHKSQNCDESDELPLRISVRAVATWVDSNPNNMQRKFVEWASSFIGCAYEWGGYWYGGRADLSPQHSGAKLRRAGTSYRVDYEGHAYYDGYGIDCSGLVSAAARLAGYFGGSFVRLTTKSLANTGYGYCISVPIERLKPGDLLVKSGSHVVIVYRVLGVVQLGSNLEALLEILHATGEPENPTGRDRSVGHQVLVENATIIISPQSDRIIAGAGSTTGVDLADYVIRRLRN